MSHPRHFFLDCTAEDFIPGKTHALSDSDAHHVRDVLRLKNHSQVTVVCKHSESSAIGTLLIEQSHVYVKIESIIPITAEQSAVSTLLCGMCQAKKCELIIEKATELGIKEIIFFVAERSEDKKNKDFSNKLVRWNKIIESSAKQSKRTSLPKIFILKNLQDSIDKLNSQNLKTRLLMSTSKDAEKFTKLKLATPIVIAVGPEGDFTDSEFKLLTDNSFIPTTLGDTTLRTETACLVGIVKAQTLCNSN